MQRLSCQPALSVFSKSPSKAVRDRSHNVLECRLLSGDNHHFCRHSRIEITAIEFLTFLCIDGDARKKVRGAVVFVGKAIGRDAGDAPLTGLTFFIFIY
jgi:hypothetical protein